MRGFWSEKQKHRPQILTVVLMLPTQHIWQFSWVYVGAEQTISVQWSHVLRGHAASCREGLPAHRCSICSAEIVLVWQPTSLPAKCWSKASVCPGLHHLSVRCPGGALQAGGTHPRASRQLLCQFLRWCEANGAVLLSSQSCFLLCSQRNGMEGTLHHLIFAFFVLFCFPGGHRDHGQNEQQIFISYKHTVQEEISADIRRSQSPLCYHCDIAYLSPSSDKSQPGLRNRTVKKTLSDFCCRSAAGLSLPRPAVPYRYLPTALPVTH